MLHKRSTTMLVFGGLSRPDASSPLQVRMLCCRACSVCLTINLYQNFNDIWALDLSESLSGLAWVKLAPPTAPPARHEQVSIGGFVLSSPYTHCCAIQVAVMLGDSMFIFGGVITTGSTGSMTVFGDTWQYRYDINQWREVRFMGCCAQCYYHHNSCWAHRSSNRPRLPRRDSPTPGPSYFLPTVPATTGDFLLFPRVKARLILS